VNVYIVTFPDGTISRVFRNEADAETFDKRSPYDHYLRRWPVTEEVPERTDWWCAGWSSRGGIEDPYPCLHWSDEPAEYAETADPAISSNPAHISVRSTDRDRAVALLAELVEAREAEDAARSRSAQEAHQKLIDEMTARDGADA